MLSTSAESFQPTSQPGRPPTCGQEGFRVGEDPECRDEKDEDGRLRLISPLSFHSCHHPVQQVQSILYTTVTKYRLVLARSRSPASETRRPDRVWMMALRSFRKVMLAFLSNAHRSNGLQVTTMGDLSSYPTLAYCRTHVDPRCGLCFSTKEACNSGDDYIYIASATTSSTMRPKS
jgi:hypothetical protein